VAIIKKLISGGQTGADTGALVAARELGIETGGFAPKGWLTESGPQEKLLRGFGLVECEQEGYPARTRRNVSEADGTLIIGRYRTGGTGLTYETARRMKKPLFLVALAAPLRTKRFRSWLERHNIQVLNVAGARESEGPGIADFTYRFLLTALAAGTVDE